MTDQPATPTAAVLVIGDEVLSGRTKEKNIGTIADTLTAIGIDLREARIVGDGEDDIVAALNALRARYDLVFTTGGIGPTHDDITADAVAKAFGVAISEDARAIALMLERYKPEELNEARRRMARIPHGASLIENSVSKAPGFRIGNVIVMAGIPGVMQAMLERVVPTLPTGAKVHSHTIEAGKLPEGVYAKGLGALAKAHEGVAFGSYPSMGPEGFRNQIVVRSRDETKLAAAADAVRALLADLSADSVPM
jgi:molybdenum cofactor synthesis domain-containing protein